MKVAFRCTDPGPVISVCTVNADGSGRSTPLHLGDEPSWSPDGLKIAFEVSGQVWVMDADGNNPGSLRPARRPIGHPTARRSRSGAQETSGRSLRAEGARHRSPRREPTNIPTGRRMAARSPSVGTPGSGTRIWTVDANGSNPTELTSGTQDTRASWAPDGSQIAFRTRP